MKDIKNIIKNMSYKDLCDLSNLVENQKLSKKPEHIDLWVISGADDYEWYLTLEDAANAIPRICRYINSIGNGFYPLSISCVSTDSAEVADLIKIRVGKESVEEESDSYWLVENGELRGYYDTFEAVQNDFNSRIGYIEKQYKEHQDLWPTVQIVKEFVITSWEGTYDKH